MWPAKRGPIHVSLVQGIRPPRTRLTSKLVPPVSATIASAASASSSATRAPATGAMAGPDFSTWIGASAAAAASITPPWLVVMSSLPSKPAPRRRPHNPRR